MRFAVCVWVVQVHHIVSATLTFVSGRLYGKLCRLAVLTGIAEASTVVYVVRTAVADDAPTCPLPRSRVPPHSTLGWTALRLRMPSDINGPRGGAKACRPRWLPRAAAQLPTRVLTAALLPRCAQ